jgi:ATP-binding cassette subfamily F protein 3
MGFEGTVVLVSHDRRFLENVTTRTVSVRDGKCDVYPGGFRDFTAAAGKRTAAATSPKKSEKSEKSEKAKAHEQTVSRSEPIAKLDRKAAFEQEKASARALERKQKRAAELEDLIAAAEAKVNTLRDQLKEDPAGNWEKVANLAREEQSLSKRIDTLMAEWSILQEELAPAPPGAAQVKTHDNKGARP